MRVGAHRDIGGISLTEVSYPGGFVMARHTHPQAYFTLALAGSYGEQAEGTSRVCREQTVVFRPAGEPHASRFHALGGECLRVELASEWIAALPRGLRLPERSVDVSHGRASWLASQLHEELRARDTAAPVAIEGLTLALLADVSRLPRLRTRSDPLWLHRVLDRIHAEYRTPVTLADLAVCAGVHPVHLARAFRQHRGSSVAAYVRRLRLEWCRRELRSSERPLADLAQAAGYADQSHFSRVFRKATGLTPKAYREAGLGR